MADTAETTLDNAEAVLEDNAKKIEAQLKLQFTRMTQADRDQIARLMKGTHIYSAEEKALRYTILQLATPSTVNRILFDVNQTFTRPNRAARRVLISNARRQERQTARRARRLNLLAA